MTKKLALLFVSVVISVCANAQSFTAVYLFDSVTTTSGTTDPSIVPTATGVTFSNFSAAGVGVNPTATGRFSFKLWPSGGINGNNVYANLTGSLSTSQYYEVTVTPDPGYKVTLTGIKFKMLRSSTGVRTYAVRSSADGFTTNLPASISPTNTKLSVQSGNVFFWNYDSTSTSTSLNGSKITLSGSSFTNFSAPVKFRFYAWNAESTQGTFSIDNDSIFGSSMLVPIAANFTADTACFGDSTHFADVSTSQSGTITNWSWDFGDGSAINHLPNPSHRYTSGGLKNINLVVIDNLQNTDSISQLVFVDSVAATLTKSVVANVVTFTGAGSNGIPPYQTTINFGDGTFSASPNNTHTYANSGPYTACLTVVDSNGCSDSSCVSFLIIGTGINAITDSGLNIYPNPSANGVFTVNAESVFPKTIVTVHNIIGENVFSKEINLSGKHTIDLSNEPNGSYFVNIKNDSSTITRKITINK